MINISSYGIALIAGGFTIIGALISSVVTYWLIIQLDESKERRAAGARLRAAFAPALGIIDLARHQATASEIPHDVPVVGDIIKKFLPDHAAAIEVFRPFIGDNDRTEYQEAWKQYRKTVRQPNSAIDSEHWATNAPMWSDIENKINAILVFAKP